MTATITTAPTSTSALFGTGILATVAASAATVLHRSLKLKLPAPPRRHHG